MIYFSSKLYTDLSYADDANRLVAALSQYNVVYTCLTQAKDVWLRDFMPVKTNRGYVSFDYDPSYLKDSPDLKTDFHRDIQPELSLPCVAKSPINLDGGNVVFSPSKKTAVISDRVISENPHITPSQLIDQLEQALAACVVLIPSLKSDFTGHADGMVQFLDEHTVIGNDVSSKNGLEQRIKRVLRCHGIDTVDFPYQPAKGISAVGSYINYLQTDRAVFLPVFRLPSDDIAIKAAEQIFSRPVVPVEACDIAANGGVFHCISWED